MQKLELRDMLKAGVHFGHKTSRWSPKMRPYIWGSKNKIHLIDVAKSAFLLERTGTFLKNQAAQGKSFLWIGTKKPASKIIQETASALNMPYVIHRWIGGTLSNFDQVKKAITRLLYLRDVVAKPTTHYTKKELVVLTKEIERLEKNIGGIIDLTYPPGAVIVVDAKKEQSAVKEAAKLGLPVISIVDTNTNPEGVNFVIPANDDSPKSIGFIINYLKSCVEAGAKEFKAKKKDEVKAAPKKKAAAKEESPKAKAAPKKAAAAKETKKAAPKKPVAKKAVAKKTAKKATAKK